jgi:hypothetical protein
VVSIEAIGVGAINITAGTAAVGTAELATMNTVVEPKLIGHWLDGTADLVDKSGFTPAGTHDGVAVGANAGLLAYSSDVPAGYSGQSLDLSAGNVGVLIANSANFDTGYLPTFDTDIQDTFTVAFWAKGFPTDWNPWVSKRGEGGIGWQLRRWGGNPYSCFTIRGLSNEDGTGSTIDVNDNPATWHHFAGVYNQYTGTRHLYVDGVLSHVVYNNPTQTVTLAADKHLALGAREGGGTDFEAYFSGLLFDVRIYDYPLTEPEVTSLANPAAPIEPVLTAQAWTGNQIRISWPVSFTGYQIEQSLALVSGWGLSGLTVTVEGSENVAYAPTTTGTLFFRLKK